MLKLDTMISMIKLYSDGENILTINTYYIWTKSITFKLIEDMNKDQSNCSIIGNVLVVSTTAKYSEKIKEKLQTIFN